MLALTRRVRRSRAGNAAAPPLATRRRRSPAADRAHGALSHVAVRAGTALPRWLPCRAAPPPAGLAAVPRCPFPLAAVPLTRPLQGPLLRANAGDEGDARRGSACGPPPQSRTRARATHAGRRRRPRHARGLRVQAQGRGVLAVAGARPGADVLAVAGWGAEATRRVGGEHGRLGAMVP